MTFIIDKRHVLDVTSAKTGNIIQKSNLCMILGVLLYHKDLAFVNKYLEHVNQ